MKSYDFGGLASLIEAPSTEEQPELRAQLIEVARAWCHEILNPVKGAYDWDSFAELGRELGYTDQGSYFGAWDLPDMDSDFWASPATLERRIETFYKVKAQGGPKPQQQPQKQPQKQPQMVPQNVVPMPPPQVTTQWPPQQVAGGAAWQPQQPTGWNAAPQGPQGQACRKCGSPNLTIRNSKKEGPNFGRPYKGCTDCNAFHSWAS